MKVFLEQQFVKWWWLTMFILAIIGIIFGTGYYSTLDSDEDTRLIVSVICCLVAFPIVFGLLYLRLETRMDEKGIFTYFRPFGFTKRFFAWEEMKEVYVREYNAFSEFGGWGIRILRGNSKAYIIGGKKGIQIITLEGKKFLVGTEKPGDAQATINNYKAKNNNEY